MKTMFSFKLIITLTLFLTLSKSSFSQQNKYPSLLWEITKKGSIKKSYLFGTMHVSNKMVFNLSDSFYQAIANVEAVALELDPAVWQKDMKDLEAYKQAYSKYRSEDKFYYMSDKSFIYTSYEKLLPKAIGATPQIANMLLYRNTSVQADFEEETFLDVSIYQAAKKLKKQTYGLENLKESDSVIIQGELNQLLDESKKEYNDYGSIDVYTKIEKAYRDGNLDLMDSLQVKTMESQKLYNEKFLYQRNYIQSHSIDTILKTKTLFAAVGAAHLAGKRGIIEILRNKGYTLRPVQILRYNSKIKAKLDTIKVSFTYQKQNFKDNNIELSTPGTMYVVDEDNEYQSWQYSDMSTGIYFLLNKIKIDFKNQIGGSDKIFNKIDSNLYEWIPGKIQSKKIITKFGYKGFDITNITRKGDLQRQQIFVTQNEIIIIKMSGTKLYMDSKSTDVYFNSFRINKSYQNNNKYSHSSGLWAMQLPQQPKELKKTQTDYSLSISYSYDSTHKIYYQILNRHINSDMLLEDSVELNFMEMAFLESYKNINTLDSKFEITSVNKSKKCLYSLPNKLFMEVHYFTKGNQYYIISALAKSKEQLKKSSINSFELLPINYDLKEKYSDKNWDLKIKTTNKISLDQNFMDQIEDKKIYEKLALSKDEYKLENYTKRSSLIFIQDPRSKETFSLKIEKKNKYYRTKNDTIFWNNITNENIFKNINNSKNYNSISEKISSNYSSKNGYQNDPMLKVWDTAQNITPILTKNGTKGYRYEIKNPASSKKIVAFVWAFNEINYSTQFRIDTIDNKSFANEIIKNIEFNAKGNNVLPFEKEGSQIFNDFESKDSTTKAIAKKGLTKYFIGTNMVNRFTETIKNIKNTEKNYLKFKTSLIAELGYIDDSTDVTANVIYDFYKNANDTALFKTAALSALAQNGSAKAAIYLEDIFKNDPPIFDNKEDYNQLFEQIGSEQKNFKKLFEPFMEIKSIPDYKNQIEDLWVNWAEEKVINPSQYESHINSLITEAKLEIKKEQLRLTKKKQEENQKKINLAAEKNNDETNVSTKDTFDATTVAVKIGDEDDDERDYKYNYENNNDNIIFYIKLLAPFYNNKPEVKQLFTNIFNTDNKDLKLQSWILLKKNNQTINDTIINYLAKDPYYLMSLYKELQNNNLLTYFTKQYRNQKTFALSILKNEKTEKFKMHALELIDTVLLKINNNTYIAYGYKYKIKEKDKWKIAIAGLQPNIKDSVFINKTFTQFYDKEFSLKKSEKDQIKKIINKIYLNTLLDNDNKFFTTIFKNEDDDEDEENEYEGY